MSLKNEYRPIVGGKITLPASYNDTPIIGIAEFESVPNLTEIYIYGCENIKPILSRTLLSNKNIKKSNNFHKKNAILKSKG